MLSDEDPSSPLGCMLTTCPPCTLQALLGDVRDLVGEARWGELDDALKRIQGVPNNLESNVRDAAYSKCFATHICTCWNSAFLLLERHQPIIGYRGSTQLVPPASLQFCQGQHL